MPLMLLSIHEMFKLFKYLIALYFNNILPMICVENTVLIVVLYNLTMTRWLIKHYFKLYPKRVSLDFPPLLPFLLPTLLPPAGGGKTPVARPALLAACKTQLFCFRYQSVFPAVPVQHY